MEVKKDWLSGVLKVLLCFSFVYLWVMALGYVKKSYCGIPGAAVFLIAALLDGILVWCVWKKKKLKSDKTTTIKTRKYLSVVCIPCIAGTSVCRDLERGFQDGMGSGRSLVWRSFRGDGESGWHQQHGILFFCVSQ